MRTRQNRILQILFTVAAAGWIAFVFSNSMLNAEQSSANSAGFFNALQNLFNAVGLPFGLTEYGIRKAAHFAEFAVLGILLMIAVRMYSPRPVRHLFPPFFIGLATAVTDEYIQLFSKGRSSQVGDIVLDFAGLAAGIVICLLVICLVDRRRQRNSLRYHF